MSKATHLNIWGYGFKDHDLHCLYEINIPGMRVRSKAENGTAVSITWQELLKIIDKLQEPFYLEFGDTVITGHHRYDFRKRSKRKAPGLRPSERNPRKGDLKWNWECTRCEITHDDNNTYREGGSCPKCGSQLVTKAAATRLRNKDFFKRQHSHHAALLKTIVITAKKRTRLTKGNWECVDCKPGINLDTFYAKSGSCPICWKALVTKREGDQIRLARTKEAAQRRKVIMGLYKKNPIQILSVDETASKRMFNWECVNCNPDFDSDETYSSGGPCPVCWKELVTLTAGVRLRAIRDTEISQRRQNLAD